MAVQIRNLDFIRQLSSEDLPGFGAKLYEALSDIAQQSDNHAQQTNANLQGAPLPPPAINNIAVSAQNGHFSVQIQDNGEIYRGVQYYVEHSDSPNFTNPQVIHLGDSRNHTVFLGDVTRYFRAYSSYASSPPSAPAYLGGSVPTPVTGGGPVGGPDFQESQGSGTGPAGAGLQGPGVAPFRSLTGAPPIRGNPSGSGASGGGAGGLTLIPQSSGAPSGFSASPGSGFGSSYRVLEDTHVNRLANYPAANYSVGQQFFETNDTLTDRQSLYVVQQISSVKYWVYVSGLYVASFASMPSDLGMKDVGFQFRDTTYLHRWRWSGSAWALDGESSQQMVLAGSAPAGGVWYPCDGGTYTCVTATGGTVSIVTQDLTQVAALMGGGYSTTLHPATSPTWDPAATTDTTSIAGHTHPVTQTGFTLSAGATLVDTADPTSLNSVTAHAHNLTDAFAVINPPSDAAGGLPKYYKTSWWLRA